MMWPEQWMIGVRAVCDSPVILYLIVTAGLVGVASQDTLTWKAGGRILLRLINGLLLGITLSLFAPQTLVMAVMGLAMLVSLLVAIHVPLRHAFGQGIFQRVPALLAGLVVALLFLGHEVASTPFAILLGVMMTVMWGVLLCWAIFALIGRLLPRAAFVIVQRVLGAWMVAIGAMSLTFIVMQW
ncbi:hypothetical protein [Cobetia marina]|uniref:hypothetical protein n=1 Tax=Cobetia marina TaxID=28258 RepID=UPI0025496E5F|nr:hypothetical protein [Cobetia pacifica]MDI6004216.1 hypothetical protein [Cobetia pacifica]